MARPGPRVAHVEHASEPPDLTLLTSPPRTLPSLLDAARHRPPPPGSDASIAPHGLRMASWMPGEEQLGRYRDVVASTARAPLLFPALPAMQLHRALVGAGGIPAPAVGLVHVGSQIWVTGSLPTDRPWDVTAWAEGGRRVRSGLEFDLWARCRAGDAEWLTRAVTLARSRTAAGQETSVARAEPDAQEVAAYPEQATLAAEERTGRAYARVSGDYNPIHLHALTAKPLGFARAIAHGWWVLARALALMTLDDPPGPGRTITLDASFRRPVLLPSSPRLRFDEPHTGEEVRFALTGDAGAVGKVHMAGLLSPGRP